MPEIREVIGIEGLWSKIEGGGTVGEKGAAAVLRSHGRDKRY